MTSCGPRTDGRRHNEPGLAARLTAAVQLHAHTSLWAEPAEWAGRLSLVIDPHDAMAPHVWAAMANAAAHAGRLTDGLQLAERALASDDLRAVAVALEAIADIAMYQGDLARCRDAARQLGDVGRRLDDPHATVLGHVDQALALVYADDHDAALPILDGLAPRQGSLPPIGPGSCTPRARRWPTLIRCGRWRRSTRRSTWPTTSATGSLAASRACPRRPCTLDPANPDHALQAFAGIIDEWRRQGNLTHLTISLRNLVELFARVGAVEAASELLGALQPAPVTAAYGAEAQRLAETRATLERTAGEHAVARWV